MKHRTICPTCREVLVPRGDITLMISAQEPADTFMFFTCPECSDVVRRNPGPVEVILLNQAKVRVLAWDLPNRDAHTGPRIDYDDLLDFVLQLGTTDYLAAEAVTA